MYSIKNMYIRKEERFELNHLNFHLKLIAKQKQAKFKARERKDINKVNS